MKHKHGNKALSPSCSCTSCTHLNSDSNRPSYRNLVTQGSRVDKLFLGRYIPLREKKLIAKLVRTRAVYDDLRTQILSGSNLSVSNKADLRPRENLPFAHRGKELDDAKKSSAILELVNLVDKGATKRLSDCCSCCSCGSTIPLHDQTRPETKLPRHSRVHISSRSSMISGQKDDLRNGTHVKHKAKHVSSEPCTCTAKFGLTYRESFETYNKSVNRLRRKKPKPTFDPPFPPFEEFDENRIRNINNKKLKGYKTKLYGMGETARKSLTKVKRSKTSLLKKFKAGTKSSLEHIRNVEQKLKGKTEKRVRKKVYKSSPVSQAINDDEIVYNAIKDSLTMYKKEIKNKFKECDFVCDPEVCLPEECLRIKVKTKKKQRNELDNIARTAETSTASEAEIQAENTYTSQNKKMKARNGGLALRRCFCTLKLKPNKNKPKIRKLHKKTSQTVSKSLQTMKLPQLPDLLPYECEPMVCIPEKCNPIECQKRIKNRGIYYSTMTKNATYKSRSTPSLTSKSVSSGESKILKTEKTINAESLQGHHNIQNEFIEKAKLPRQAVRISSNFSVNIEFYKNKQNSVYGNSNNTRPIIYTQSKRKEGKQIGHRTLKSSEITISEKSKYTLARHHLRRCFCTLKLSKPKTERHKIPSFSKGTITTQQSDGMLVTAKQMRKSCECKEVIDRSTEMRDIKTIAKYGLLPYECEPGICIPGECNPYMCLKLINDRKKVKTHTRESGTNQRKTRSSYSFTRKRNISHVKVQSVSTSQKKQRTAAKWGPAPRQTKSSPETFNNQAVRIGSSFSFNIEFFKENLPALYQNQHYVGQQPSKHVVRKEAKKEKKSAGLSVKIRNKSSAVQTEKEGKKVITQSDIKRCFCTLKLHKMARNKNKINVKSTGTKLGKEEMYPKTEMATKSRNIKKMAHKLEPYECEPYFCVPGQCDPNQCLERIKTRGNVKSKEFGVVANTLRRKSTSSSTKNNNKVKDAISQSYQKTKKNVLYKYTPYTNSSTEIGQKCASRQAVRIGSNFSFNIEFSKSRPNKYNSKVSASGRTETLKHKGHNFSGTYRKLGTSQTMEIKKMTKSTGIRPILKRCFCTLKLQNNNIRNSPTVMPVLVKNQSFSKMIKEELKHKFLLRQSMQTGSYSSSFSSMFSSSYANSSHYTAYKDFESYQKSEINNFGLVLNSKSIVTDLHHRNTFIGVNRYLKSSFYAMNIQVQHKQKQRHKLEPYECEPGICIPGKCNPIECQKLIMKRLMKKASTMASTGTRSQSVSSGTMNSKSKKQQHNKLILKSENEHHGIKYKTLPRSHKQVVRVGSSFSFNIEFSKSRTTAQQGFNQSKKNKVLGSSINTNSNTSESRSTRASQVSRQHRISQSVVPMQHRGSNTATNRERCFCTLKIEKKGRQNKKVNSRAKDKNENKPGIVKTAEMGQNTNKQKTYSLFNLDPNECEPGVCVPGECDPHVCLERIKKIRAKNFGTNMKANRNSASRMTSSQKRHLKNKQVQMKQKPIRAVKLPMENKYLTIPKTPSRQVVRIGSSFSFDVEFFKDKSPNGEINIPTVLPSKTHVHKPTKSQKVETDRNIKQKSSQDSKSTRHQDSQVETRAQHDKFTKTGSLLKRCFCTATLHKTKRDPHKNSTTNRRPSFLKRCFCVLKSMTATKPKPIKTESVQSVQTKKIKERDIKTLNLDPNECEPGVCVPGECDPRICLERIKKRKTNFDKISSTESTTRSTATLFQSPKTSKSTATNVYMQNKNKINKPQVIQQSISEKRPKSPERNAVRIGSNFSFSMEFYKEKYSHENVQKPVRDKYHSVSATESSKTSPIKNKTKGAYKAVLLHNRESQMNHVNKANKSSDTGLITLKRCFCTLALRKQSAGEKNAKLKKENNGKGKGRKVERTSKTTGTTMKKNKHFDEHKQKPSNLEPYECEPGVCVPGECDPYECEKLIKRRRRKDSGTETMKQTSKSATTMKKNSSKKHKDQNTHTLKQRKHATASKKHQPVKRSSISSSSARQVVRIGSNFSFNVEFAKSKTGDGNNFNDTEPAKVRKEMKSQSPSLRVKKTQDQKHVRHAYSQVLANKVRSTVTEVTPILKRCFCTLKLKKSELPKKNIKVVKPVPYNVTQVSRVTNTDKPKYNHRTLEQHECEPAICVPGKCDPLKCLKIIQRRMQAKMSPQVSRVTNTNKPKYNRRTLEPYECEPGICIPGKCNPQKCLKIIQKRMQAKMSNTEALRRDNMSTTTTTSKPEHSGMQTMAEKRRREAGDNPRTENRRLPNNNNKQAVRISSNFSFNIEFFKDTSDGINVPKTLTFDKEPKLPKITKSSRASGYQSKLVGRNFQSPVPKTESKGSGVGPLMKRCFCTLKLQKVGKLQKASKSVNKMRDNSASAKIITKIDDSRILKNTGTSTKKRQALEPYECEPNTCIPGKCNPLECYERIKLRNLNEFGTDTMRPSMKSVFSLTDQNVQPKNMQTLTQKTVVPKSNRDEKRKVERISHTAGDQNRQAVRIGSNFNFNIEFYKDSSPKPMDNVMRAKPTTIDTSNKKIKAKLNETTSQGSESLSPSAQHRAQQADVVQQSVGSGITPLMKRCFCTLTLHHTETNKLTYYAKNKSSKVTKKQKELPVNSNSGGIAPILKRCFCTLSLNKSDANANDRTSKVSTRKQPQSTKKPSPKKIEGELPSKNSNGGIALLKKCFCSFTHNNTETNKIANAKGRSSKVCAKKCSRKEKELPKNSKGDNEPVLKRQSRSSRNKSLTLKKQKELPPDLDDDVHGQFQSLRRCTKPSGYGCSGMDPDGAKANIPMVHRQFRYSRRHTKPSGYGPSEMNSNGAKANMPMIVEQPRFPFVDRKNWQGVKIGSNFSFNIEFNKASALSKQNKQRGNVVTHGRVDKILTMSPFKPTEYYIYQTKPHRCIFPNDFIRKEIKTANSKVNNNKNLDRDPVPNMQTQVNVMGELLSIDVNNGTRHDSIKKEIKTVLPHSPRKFQRNESNALFSHKGIAKGAKKYCQGKCCKVVKEQNFNTKEANSKFIKLTNKEKKIMLPQSPMPMVIILKKFFCMFSNGRDENAKHINPISNPNNITPIKPNAEIIKKDKSVKCPEKITFNKLKKSKSLNITAIADKKNEQVKQKNKHYSRLQSGDANMRQNALFLNRNITHNNGLRENMTSDSSKPENQGLFFECVHKLNGCKNEFKNSHLKYTQMKKSTYSGRRQSCPCCVCKSKKAKQPYAAKVIVYFCNEQRKEQALSNTKGAMRPSKKYFGQEPCVNSGNVCRKQKKVKINNETIELQQLNKIKHKPRKKIKQHKTDRKYIQILPPDAMRAESVKITKLNAKLKQCPAKNYFIQKSFPESYRKPSDFVCKNISSPKKKPWLTVNPFGLSMLVIWKQFTNKVLFLLAIVAAVWRPCVSLVKGCKAAM